MIFFAQSTLQNASDDAARLVRTGQAQNNGMTQAQYLQQICGEMTGLVSSTSCASNLQVDMQSFTDFSGANYNNVTNANGSLNNKQMQYLTGGPCDVVLVRAFLSVEHHGRRFWHRSSPTCRTASICFRPGRLSATNPMRVAPHAEAYEPVSAYDKRARGCLVSAARAGPRHGAHGHDRVVYRALECRQKVSSETSSIADLVSQTSSVSAADLTNIFNAGNSDPVSFRARQCAGCGYEHRESADRCQRRGLEPTI